MPTLRDSDINDVLVCFDSWKPFTPTADNDLFVAAIGFEERASACFADWCLTRKGTGGTAFLIEYPMNKDDNAAQAADFTKLAAESGVKVLLCRYERLALYGEVLQFFRNKSNSNILLDLSAMASFVFYPLMSAITESSRGARLTLCYTEATRYFPDEQEWTDFKHKFKTLDLVDRARFFDEYHFQSKGVETVFESPNFPGRNDNQPTTLVAIPNFSVERVQRMLNFAADNYSVNREDCEWIIGMPPNRAMNGWRYEALWELFHQPARKRDACTLDCKEVLVALQEIWARTKDSRSLVIASVGSKAQHLGTFMFLKMHSDVGLILSEPKQFTATKYSNGVGNKWQLSIGSIGDWVDRLVGWNKIVFEW